MRLARGAVQEVWGSESEFLQVGGKGTDDAREHYARRQQPSFGLVDRGVAAEAGQLVSELRTHATRAKDGVIARVVRPGVEKRRFRGGTCGFAHAEGDETTSALWAERMGGAEGKPDLRDAVGWRSPMRRSVAS